MSRVPATPILWMPNSCGGLRFGEVEARKDFGLNFSA